MTKEEAIIRLKEGEPFSEIYDPVWDEALNMAISALSAPTANVISIDQANAMIKSYVSHYEENKGEDRPKGHWIRVIDKSGHSVWECDKCGWQQRLHTNYCPDCGADMREPKEEKIRCNTCKNNDDELSGECYECVKGIFDHYEPKRSESNE